MNSSSPPTTSTSSSISDIFESYRHCFNPKISSNALSRKPKKTTIPSKISSKPTARTKSLSLNVDEINEGDTNNFFYNNFKFHNDVVDLKKGDKNMNAPTSNNRKRMPSLGISPSSAFGKPSNFSYK